MIYLCINPRIRYRSTRRSAVHLRGTDHRGHRLRVPAQVLHDSRSGLRHAVRPAHHNRGQHPPEETRGQEPGRARRTRPQDTPVRRAR